MSLAVCKTLSDKSLTVILQCMQVSFGCKYNNIYQKFKIFKYVIKHILTVCLQSIFAFIVWQYHMPKACPTLRNALAKKQLRLFAF